MNSSSIIRKKQTLLCLITFNCFYHYKEKLRKLLYEALQWFRYQRFSARKNIFPPKLPLKAKIASLCTSSVHHLHSCIGPLMQAQRPRSKKSPRIAGTIYRRQAPGTWSRRALIRALRDRCKSRAMRQPSVAWRSRAGWPSLTWYRAASCSWTHSPPSSPASTTPQTPFSMSWKPRRPQAKMFVSAQPPILEPQLTHIANPASTSCPSTTLKCRGERKMSKRLWNRFKSRQWPMKMRHRTRKT